MSQSNDGPPERDVKDFRFQQLCKVRVSAPLDEVRTDRSQWIATSNKFGLIFVGLKDGFKVLKTADICHVDGVNARDRSTAIISDFPFWSSVTITNPISHLALSCDELTLVVVMKECGNLMLCMYDVRQFAVKTDSSVAFARCRLNASPGSSLQDIMWNPLDPTLLAVCVSDGSVELIRVTNSVQTVGSLPVSSNASCLNWSPKGRQLVVGRKDGTMIQFDQEMKEKRSWPMPSILATTHQVVDVTWLSTYVFLAAYLPSTAESSDQPQVLLTVSSKDGPTSYVNFEDVCYGSGEDRRHKYFFMFLAKWDMVVLSSSNATEAAVVAKHPDGGLTSVWEHWTLEDSGRAELPLTANHLDSFPMGVTLTLGCQTPITLGDNKTHPPSPILLMLSTDGLLVPYYLLNHNNGAPSLTVPLEQLTSTGARTSTDALQPSTPGSAMLGAQKLSQPVSTLGQGSTLPKTGSSFQFVQKAPTTASDTPGASLFSQPKTGLDTPGASLFSQPKTSSLPTTGSSFQFVTKPSQPTSDMPGRQAFTPVVTQVANVTPASGSQKTGMPFTPSSSGATTAFSPATTKVQVLSTPSIGTKSVFGVNTGALDLGATKPDAEKAATLPSFGFSTVPSTTSSNTAGGVSGFGQPAGKSMFGGSTSFTGFGFPKPPPTTAPATSAAAAPTATSTPAAAQGVTSAGFGGNTFTKPTESSAQKNSTGGFGGFTMGQTVTPIPAPGRSPPSQAPPSLPPTSLPQASSKGVTLGVKRDIEEEARQSEEEAPLPPPYEKPSVNETVESTFTRSIMEEMQHFEKELRDLKLRSGNSLKEVGTRKEMLDLRRATEDMAKFCHDIKENTKEQSREVHDHKSLCLELFAMVEECRVRQERNDDPKYHKLLRSRALDPASADKLKQLQAQYQAQSQGLVEVDLILDQQWEEHQDRKKAIKGRLQAPTSDMVYRAVKSNHNLIRTQKTQLEKLQENLKNLQLYNRSADWQNMSMFRTDTSRSPDITSLVNSLGRGSAQPGLSLAGSVSPEKTAQLRQFLAQRTVPRIRSTKPGNLSMSRIVAAKGLREKLEDVRSPRSSPGGDQTTPLQLVRPREEYSDPTGDRARFLPTGQGNLKKLPPTNNNAISQARSQSDLHPARSVQITAAMKNNSRTDSQQRGFGGLEPVYRNTGRGVSSEELTSAMLRMKETLTATYSGGGQHPDVEDISPSFTPELESDEQEGLTEEDEGEYDDEEDDDDEEEAGFGVEYSLESRTDASGDNEQNQHKHGGSAGTPLSSLQSAVPTDQKAGVSKNLFGGSKTFISDQLSTGKLSTSTPAMMAKQPSNTPPVAASGFGFSTGLGASGLAGKSLFGSGSAGDPRVKTPDVDACAEDEATAGKIQAKGFSFSTAPSTTTASPSTSAASTTTASTAPSGFSFTVPGGSATATSGAAAAGGFSFGANSGIFSKPSTETAKPQSTSYSAFGGGTFGGKSDTTTTTTTPSVTSSVSAAAVTAALNSSLLAALTDTSTTSTSAASVTASAALGSSLLAALTDASSTAPQEAAAALSSFSFKPGDSPSQPTEQGNTSLAVSGATTTASTSADTPATAVTAAASNLFGLSSGGFGQPAKFGGSPPGGATTTTTTAQFGGSAGVFGSTGPTSFGALATTTQVSSTDDTTTTSTTSATVTKSLFGTTPTTSASTAAFGQTATASTEAAATPSQAAATTTTTAASTGFAFGSSSSTTSIFGGSSAANTSSAFGGGTATTGVFASSTATTTTPSVFGTTAPGTATSGFGFGQNTTGFAKPSFGQSPGFSQTSSFGEGSGAFGAGGSVFGQTATTTSSSAFGQSTTTTTASSDAVVFGGGGGGLFGGLGGKPSADKANKNVFGGGTFGTTDNTQNTGLFGNSGSTSFGGKSDGGFGSGGGFSGGSGVAATGFGVGQSTQAPAGFGGQPSFGGSPSLGTSSFGGAPSFGSPGGGFGTSAAFTSPVGTTATFGSAGGQGGFASFASGNSPTFGNIAQSSAPSFGNLATSTGGGFGAAAGGFGNTAGGFGSPAGGFGSPAGGFGSPAGGGFGVTQPTGGFGATQQGGGFGATQQGGGFGATQQGGGFGSPQPGTGGNFGSSPQFTSYRG